KCKHLVQYCGRKVAELLKNLPEAKGNSFKELVDRLRDFYGQTDNKKRYTRECLACYCFKPHSIKSEADLDTYYRKFVTQAHHLQAKGMIAERDENDLFWQGIP
ncbi:hypothetical protein BS47DRAFT_1297907, partial [Hydnum rufescens UP504]